MTVRGYRILAEVAYWGMIVCILALFYGWAVWCKQHPCPAHTHQHPAKHPSHLPMPQGG